MKNRGSNKQIKRGKTKEHKHFYYFFNLAAVAREKNTSHQRKQMDLSVEIIKGIFKGFRI